MEKFANPANFHRPMILQDGIKFEQASMKASEAQLLEARKWQISEIARFFRIPLHMLGVDDQTNRSTVEEQSINFVKYTIRPWARRIEQAVRRDLVIATRNYEAKYNLDALERGNLRPAGIIGRRRSVRAATARLDERQRGPDRGRLNPGTSLGLAGPAGQIGTPVEPAPRVADPAGACSDRGAGDTPRARGQFADARAERLARKENKAFSKALVRHAGDPDTMRDWIKAFYGGHVSCVMEILDLRKNEAKVYCDFQKKEALEANDWPGCSNDAKSTSPARSPRVLKKFGAKHGPDAEV
jgi:hypothetical protein